MVLKTTPKTMSVTIEPCLQAGNCLQPYNLFVSSTHESPQLGCSVNTPCVGRLTVNADAAVAAVLYLETSTGSCNGLTHQLRYAGDGVNTHVDWTNACRALL